MPAEPRPAIDVVDSTWIRARASVVAALLADPANWRRWWPGLELRVDELRREKGVRWHVDSVVEPGAGTGAGAASSLSGSAEVWLQPMFDGVVAHFFLRLDPGPGGVPRRTLERIAVHYRLRTKRAFWALADQLDPGRLDRHSSASHASVT